MYAFCKEVQPENASSEMVFTLLGMKISVRPVQSLKAISPMVLSSVEREMRLRLAQPLNASLAIVFTVSGILMDARELQPENAATPISVV